MLTEPRANDDRTVVVALEMISSDFETCKIKIEPCLVRGSF